MRCLSKITDTQGNEFNLMQINDFSVITSEIKGKGVAETRIYQQSSHSVPSWISVQGDKIFSASTMSSDEKYLVNDDYTLIAYNHITVGGDNFYGTAMYNKLNSNARAGGGGDSNPSSYGLDQWLGIVLDDDNQRAYLIFATDKYNAGSNNYYRVYVETGNYNGTDIYWETFGEVILNQSAGGGGLYGGYKGGAGSGYIGNSLLSNKKMVGYNVPTSSAESTKTESVNEASATPVSGKPKIENGFAKIKFLREWHIPEELQPYIDNINGKQIPSVQLNDMANFFWGDSENRSDWTAARWYAHDEFITNSFKDFPIENYSWIPTNTNYIGGARTNYLMGIDMIDVRIVNNNGTYNLESDNCVPAVTFVRDIYGTANSIIFYQYTSGDDTIASIYGHTSGSQAFSKLTYSGTLEECFVFLAKKVRNCHIYVDGVKLA